MLLPDTLDLWNCKTDWPLSLSVMFSGFIHAIHVFLMTNNILLYEYTTFCSVHHWLDLGVVTTFELLWIMLLQTFLYKFLCELCFHSPWVYPQPWNRWVIWNSKYELWGNDRLSSQITALFYVPTRNAGISSYSIFSPTFVIWLLILVMLLCVQWFWLWL